MGGNIPSEDFLGGNLPGGELSKGEFDGWKCFRWEFPRGDFLRNVSISPIFSKDYQQI